MDRRFLTVLLVSLVFALVVSGMFYQMTARAGSAPKTPAPTDLKDLVVAARPMPIGVLIKPGDVKTIKFPTEQFPRGGFSKMEEVFERPVVSPLLAEDPVLEGRLAPRNSGYGIAPLLKAGQRAVSVRVNDEVGVAGWVMPGMRVDVLVTGRPPTSDQIMTSTVLQNIQVLSVGSTAQSDGKSQTISAPTVTLLVSAEQAETLTLAGNEGRIKLVLRNGMDQQVEPTPGRTVAELYGERARASIRQQARKQAQEGDAPPAPVRRARVVPPAPVVPMAPPPVPPPPPAAPEIVVFRGSQKTVETVTAPRTNQ